MHNSEKNKLKLLLKCINRLYLNIALFNATKKESSTYFPIRTIMVFSYSYKSYLIRGKNGVRS